MHKLAPITKESFRVVSTSGTTVVAQIDGRQKGLSADGVVLAPALGELLHKKILQETEHESPTSIQQKRKARRITTMLEEKKSMSSIGGLTTQTRTAARRLR